MQQAPNRGDVLSMDLPKQDHITAPCGGPQDRSSGHDLYFVSHNPTSESLALELGRYFVVEGFLSILKYTT